VKCLRLRDDGSTMSSMFSVTYMSETILKYDDNIVRGDIVFILVLDTWEWLILVYICSH
jgi:hypothetical protein